MRKVVFFALLILVFQPRISLADSISEVKKTWGEFVKAESSYDSKLFDLYYYDKAIIKNKRTYPDGQVKELVLSVEKLKSLAVVALPIGKLRGDYNTYTDVKFMDQNGSVVVSANRYSVLKKYHSPIFWLFARAPTGKWLIVQEHSESQP